MPQFMPPPTIICTTKKIVARTIITMTELELACFKISCSKMSLFLFSALLFSNISSFFIEKPPNRIAKFSWRFFIIVLPGTLVNKFCQVLFAKSRPIFIFCLCADKGDKLKTRLPPQSLIFLCANQFTIDNLSCTGLNVGNFSFILFLHQIQSFLLL